MRVMTKNRIPSIYPDVEKAYQSNLLAYQIALLRLEGHLQGLPIKDFEHAAQILSLAFVVPREEVLADLLATKNPN